MDAITMLRTDHDNVQGLQRELEMTTERGVRTRVGLAQSELWFPAIR